MSANRLRPCPQTGSHVFGQPRRASDSHGGRRTATEGVPTIDRHLYNVGTGSVRVRKPAPSVSTNRLRPCPQTGSVRVRKPASSVSANRFTRIRTATEGVPTIDRHLYNVGTGSVRVRKPAPSVSTNRLRPCPQTGSVRVRKPASSVSTNRFTRIRTATEGVPTFRHKKTGRAGFLNLQRSGHARHHASVANASVSAAVNSALLSSPFSTSKLS